MKYFIFSFALLLFSCGTSKTTSVLVPSTPLAYDATVDIIGIGQKVPDGAKLLGQIKIGDSGITAGGNCTYDKVVNDAIIQSRAMGGNLLQIRQHKEPNILLSSCHRIWCDVYKK